MDVDSGAEERVDASKEGRDEQETRHTGLSTDTALVVAEPLTAKPLYPNFMLSDELILTGPRWRNTQELSRTHLTLLDTSILSVDSIKTLATSEAKAARRMVSLQLMLLMGSSFILALQAIVESSLNMDNQLIGSRIYVAVMNPILLAVAICYVLCNIVNRTPPLTAENGGHWIGITSDRPVPEDRERLVRLNSAARLANLTSTISDLLTLKEYRAFFPVAISWCLEDYVVFLCNRSLPPWPVRTLSLIKLPAAALLNTCFVGRSHTRTQWLFMAAITLLLVSVQTKELRLFHAASASAAVAPRTLLSLQPHHVTYAAMIMSVATTVLSCRHGHHARWQSEYRTSFQLVNVLVALFIPNLLLAFIELIHATIADVELLSVFDPRVIFFMVGHSARLVFMWTLSQQFDVMYKAVTLAFSWVLTYAFAHASGLTRNPFFEGANCLCLATTLLGYAASKSDETKVSVLRFIEKTASHARRSSA